MLCGYSSPASGFRAFYSQMVYCPYLYMYFLPTAGESTKEAPPEAEVPLDSPPVQRDGTAVIV